jgi:ATP-binding cassette subfamily C exporter for protease/lipase/ATP-binding cassette subfamily C protein EexD
VQKVLAGLRPYLVFAGLFSLAMNLLLLAPPLYMLQVFDRVLTSRSGETLLVLTLAVAMALVAMAALDVVRAYLLGALGAALDRRLGPKVIDGLLGDAARLGGREHANALRDVHCLRSFFSGSGILALFDAPWLPVFLLVIALFHPLMGAMALAGALTMLALAFANERLTRKPLERSQAEGRRAARFIDTSLRNAEVANALGMLPAVTRRWTELNEAALAEQTQATRSGAALSGLTKFTRQFIQSAMLALGAYIVLDQQVTAGVMIAATILLGRALAPVEQLVAGWRALVEARAAWRHLSELFGSRPAADPATALPVPLGRLGAENLAFGVRGMQRPIIRGVSFSLAPGEALGIIGPSASGKSTLARLLVGVWRPASGAVRLDGADVSMWPRESLGPHIGYLPQDVELFPGTIARNIARLDEPDAAGVVHAAQRAQVHELILRLPQGYDTELGEAASALSPGQRQRIALARALYGDPRLVVLDEPNANLDHDGEQALLAALRGLKEQGVTLIIIAHRPSLLGGVDKVLVLRDGAVEAFGPRAEILSRVVRRAA